MKIYDGRGSFYQWDYNQKLVMEDERVEQLHFATGEETSLICPVYEKDGLRVADVPNILLQTEGMLKVFAVAGDRTLYARSFRVNPKEKPDDYIYTETEVWTAQNAVREALQEAKESGEFDGPPGPKGDPGAVKFVVVNELPQEDKENAIYLLPAADGAQEDMFHEYIYVDGNWEKIGSTAVQVDLTGYVKTTDIATTTTPGIVRCGEGLYMSSSGKMNVSAATEDYINKKITNGRTITPAILDYAVKVGITTNTHVLSETEKTDACKWLGAAMAWCDEEGCLSLRLADGSVYRVAAVKEE